MRKHQPVLQHHPLHALLFTRAVAELAFSGKSSRKAPTGITLSRRVSPHSSTHPTLRLLVHKFTPLQQRVRSNRRFERSHRSVCAVASQRPTCHTPPRTRWRIDGGRWTDHRVADADRHAQEGVHRHGHTGGDLHLSGADGMPFPASLLPNTGSVPHLHPPTHTMIHCPPLATHRRSSGSSFSSGCSP